MNLNFTCKQIENIMNNEIQLETDTIFFMKTLKSLEERAKSIKAELFNIQTNEIKRIFKEFNENNYERRYDVSKEIVVAAIVGETDLVQIMSQDKKEKQVI